MLAVLKFKGNSVCCVITVCVFVRSCLLSERIVLVLALWVDLAVSFLQAVIRKILFKCYLVIFIANVLHVS